MGQIVTPSNAGFSPSEMDRRKFQQAVAVTLDRQAAALSATREFMADMSVRLDALEKARTDAIDAYERLEKRLEHYRECSFNEYGRAGDRHFEFVGRGFIGRLRWFLGQ